VVLWVVDKFDKIGLDVVWDVIIVEGYLIVVV